MSAVDQGVRRYPVVGGIAAWRIPLLGGLLTVGALGFGALDVAVTVAVLAGIAHGVWRSVVLEVSPAGFTRGLLMHGIFRGRITAMRWPAVVEVDTRWCRPGDDTALHTTVRDRDGNTIAFSTAMGLRAYWACLDAVVRAGAGARHEGLTDAALADGPPTHRQALSAAATAGALGLILVAVVAVHYLWAQGRPVLARYIEDVAATPGIVQPACDDEPGRRGDAGAADARHSCP